jgi:hypothetical protein
MTVINQWVPLIAIINQLEKAGAVNQLTDGVGPLDQFSR